MVRIVVVTRSALLIARRTSTWAVDEHLAGLSPGCVAVDLDSLGQMYCGTARNGLFRSPDGGRNREAVGPGIDHTIITAVDVAKRNKLTSSVSCMQVPNQVRCLALTMPAIAGWTSPHCGRSLLLAPGVFPQAPHTHHVRWIEADVSVTDRVFLHCATTGRALHERVSLGAPLQGRDGQLVRSLLRDSCLD